MGVPGNPLNPSHVPPTWGATPAARSAPGMSGLPGEAMAPASSPLGPSLSAEALFAQLQALRSELSPAQQGQLLRGLLGLPQEMRAALAMLTDPAASGKMPSSLADWLATAPDATLSPDIVREFLAKQSQAGVNKLLALMPSGPAAALSGENTKFTEMLGLLGSLSARVQQPASQPFTLLAQLYLPYCPITLREAPEPPRSQAEEDLEENGEGPAPEEGAALMLYLATACLGAFTVRVCARQRMHLAATVQHEPAAASALPAIEAAWRETMAREGLPPPEFVAMERPARIPTTPGAPESEPNASKTGTVATSVLMPPSHGVCVATFLAACALARHILQADERADTLGRRAHTSGLS